MIRSPIQLSQPGLAVRRFHGHHYLGFAGGATHSFAWFRNPKVGIIHLQQTKQFIVGIPGSQGLADLVAIGLFVLDAPWWFRNRGFEKSFQFSVKSPLFL